MDIDIPEPCQQKAPMPWGLSNSMLIWGKDWAQLVITGMVWGDWILQVGRCNYHECYRMLTFGWLAGWLLVSVCLSLSFCLSSVSLTLCALSLSLSVSFCILSIHLSTYLPIYDAVSSGPSQLVWVSPPSKPVGGGRYGCGGGDGGDVIVIICFYHS